tara:strand:- start:1443 stop:2576 length:1134 start_codon:yes stop_codon:yes gene_type:complete
MKKIITLLLIPIFSVAQTYDVLFIGNSYIYYNDLPIMLDNLANSLGDDINFEQSTPGGETLEGHSNSPLTINKINQSNWDYVILQGQSQRSALSPAYVSTNVTPFAQQLVNLIESSSSCSEPLFFMTWGRKNGDQSYCAFYPPVCTFDGMQSRLRDSYLNYGFNNSATISPVGIAWKRVMNQNSNINLYRSDNSHPSQRGTYLTACTFYATIFKKSPIGASFKPSAMNQSTATFLQTIAHQVVLDSLATWNIFNADFNYTIVNTASPTIYFNNLSSNYENLIWSFGDGTTSTTNNPTHQYSSPGNYTVTLTIYTNSGCLIDSVSQNIDIIFTNVNEIHQNQELIIESDLLGRKNKNSKIVLRLDEKGIKTKKIQLKD